MPNEARRIQCNRALRRLVSDGIADFSDVPREDCDRSSVSVPLAVAIESHDTQLFRSGFNGAMQFLVSEFVHALSEVKPKV
jgi:hypothetical protein